MEKNQHSKEAAKDKPQRERVCLNMVWEHRPSGSREEVSTPHAVVDQQFPLCPRVALLIPPTSRRAAICFEDIIGLISNNVFGGVDGGFNHLNILFILMGRQWVYTWNIVRYKHINRATSVCMRRHRAKKSFSTT